MWNLHSARNKYCGYLETWHRSFILLLNVYLHTEYWKKSLHLNPACKQLSSCCKTKFGEGLSSAVWTEQHPLTHTSGKPAIGVPFLQVAILIHFTQLDYARNSVWRSCPVLISVCCSLSDSFQGRIQKYMNRVREIVDKENGKPIFNWQTVQVRITAELKKFSLYYSHCSEVFMNWIWKKKHYLTQSSQNSVALTNKSRSFSLDLEFCYW